MILLKAKNDVVVLIGEATYHKVNGFSQVLVPAVRTEVFAETKSVKCNEFYLAHNDGIKADIVFSILFDDYSGEKEIEYKSKSYRVIRTYRINEYDVEITCTEV